VNQRIVIDPKTCHGQPVIRGTRVPVSRVLGYLAGGMSLEAVQLDFELTAEDVRAALEYVAELMDEEQHYPLPA
jgi:uncharacterized protein (DUF433 family)